MRRGALHFEQQGAIFIVEYKRLWIEGIRLAASLNMLSDDEKIERIESRVHACFSSDSRENTAQTGPAAQLYRTWAAFNAATANSS